MALPGREQFRAAVLRYVEIPGARGLNAVGLTPNIVTVFGSWYVLPQRRW